MRARRSVWSNAEVAELTTHFVPAADEVHRLQTRQDAECLLFQKVAEQGHYAGRTEPSNTRQGIYALTADGEFLASVNSTNPRTVRRMLEQALQAWRAVDRTKASPAVDLGRVRRWEDRYPDDGLILRVTSRDLPRERPPRGWHADAWNMDYAWFTKAEAGQFLPGSPEVGRVHEVPEQLIGRIALFHLVDNVRGQTSFHTAGTLRKAELITEVRAVDDNLVSLALHGETLVSNSGRWAVGGLRDRDDPSPQDLGMEMKLLGRATYDRSEERFTAFELVALGTRWGGTQFNSRGQDLEPAGIGIALTLSEDERVPPAFIWRYGW